MLSAFVPCVVLAFVITLAGLSNAQSSVCTPPTEHSLHVLVMEPGSVRDEFLRSFLLQRITALDAISERLNFSPLYSGRLLRARYQNTSSCQNLEGRFGRASYSSIGDKIDTDFPANLMPVTSALKYAVQIADYVAGPSRFENLAASVPVIVLFVETAPTTTSLESWASEDSAWTSNPDNPSCKPAEPSAAQAEAVLLKARVGLFVFASSNDVAKAWKSYFEIMKKVPFNVASLEDIKEKYESLRDSSEKRDFVAKTVANAALSMACEPQNVGDVDKSALDEETTDANSEREDDDNESTPPPDNTPSPPGEAEKDDKDDQEKPPVFEPSVSEKATQQPTTPPTPTEPTTPTPTKPPSPAPTESTTPAPAELATPPPTQPASTTPLPANRVTKLRSGAVSAAKVWLSVLLTAMAIKYQHFPG